MLSRKPLFLRAGIASCSYFSKIIAALHYYSGKAGFLIIPKCIGSSPAVMYKNLQSIWIIRLFRPLISVLIRTALKKDILRLVDFQLSLPDGGCVIVTCHTPWARLLVQYCLENYYSLIISGNKSNKQAYQIQKKGKGIIELRHLVNHLQGGGKLILMIDVFNNLDTCPLQFLNTNCNISLLPARLARIANVPLQAILPVFQHGNICIHSGPTLYPNILNTDLPGDMQTLLVFFEQEIMKNPSVWSGFVRESLSDYQKNIQV
ncbi:lysophospholipid acyltransferase family protein [Daejeonella oryzae]|uniref:hypothetical protein n=1 Tax=Daejeonella oryzae TaxID=1122943 RepID=UPI0003FC1C90|nr:hypothetical protein [Daejeonella oryzae]